MTTPTEIMTRDQVAVEDTWDLSRIFPNDAAWENDAVAARELVTTAAAHRGNLGNSAKTLRQAMDDINAANLTVERLIVYAALRRDEDIADQAAASRYERATKIAIEAGEALAFVRPEILSLPDGTLDAYMADPELAIYRHSLDDLRRRKPHTRSIEVEEVLAQQADVSRGPSDAFSALDNADMVYGTVKDEDGNDIELTKGRYQLLMESKNRDVRRGAYDVFTNAYLGHKHTLTALHAASVRGDAFQARVRNHPSARAAALFDDNIPEAVYDSLIEAVRTEQRVIERYHALKRTVLGIDSLETFDLYAPLAPEPEGHFSYQEGVDIVLSGLGPLGETYVSDLRSGFGSRWVDVHETKGKRSGAYSWGNYGAPPVILMNWNGSMDHVFTLAHEAGHAMHSLYANANQPYHDAHYTIFLAEIASTVNEVLLTWKLLADTPESEIATRFSILNRFADTLSGTLLRQTMFAEFEHRTHAMVEAGQPLTTEALSGLYGELMGAHLPGVLADERGTIAWARVPHFYRAFYVFQYATGISAAVAIARSLRDEGAPAAARYLEMLKSGGSDYSLNLLKKAGVDLTTPEPVREALKEFDATVAEMERLAELF